MCPASLRTAPSRIANGIRAAGAARQPLAGCACLNKALPASRRRLSSCNNQAKGKKEGDGSSAARRVIFSGIQPTGIPHLGNYCGALRKWVHLQNTEPATSKLLYSLVDLHAVTVRQNPGDLRRWRKESLAILLAIGLSPARAIIFHQSDVPAHSELMWILSCTTAMGALARMTQWKSKLALPDNAKPLESPLQLGLFSYPVLQAADILLYQTTHVPVGQDQVQHLELTRDCASCFNRLYGDILTEPQTILSSARRIMSLNKPLENKMSKSDMNPKSRVLITDSRDVIKSKIKAAVTDSEDGVTYDPIRRPAIANLIDIIHLLQDDATISQQDLVAGILTKSALKDKIVECIDAHLEPIRERYQELISPADRPYLLDIAEEGAEMATCSAEATMHLVRQAVGLGPTR